MHENACKDHDYCYIVIVTLMPNGNNKILKYNPGEKSIKGKHHLLFILI